MGLGTYIIRRAVVSIEEEASQYSTHTNDKPTKVAQLGWRCVYILLAWVILGYSPSPGKGYLTALCLFAFPLLLDYLKFEPDTPVRKWVRSIGIFVSGFWVFLGALGAFDVLTVTIVKDETLMVVVTEKFLVGKGAGLPLLYTWYAVCVSVLLTLVDWVAWESDLEKALKRKDVGLGQ